MTTRQRFLTGMIGGGLATAIVLGATAKDLGLVRGVTTPGVIYCAALADKIDGAVADRAECADMFDGLDPADQRLLMEDLDR